MSHFDVMLSLSTFLEELRMEAITIGVFLVVIAGGYYFFMDLLEESGLLKVLSGIKKKRQGSMHAIRNSAPSERGIKKMSWVNI